MDNVNQPQGQAPWQPAGPGSAQQPARKDWKHSRRLRWGAGITAAALLGAGGAVAGLALTGGSPVPANAAQAVALNTALSSSPVSGCPTPVNGGKSGKSGRARCLRIRLRQVKGMYGQVAYHTSSGTETLAFERGTVVSASGSTLTIRAANGTEWSWNMASSSVVRENGKAVPGSTLSTGARVFVGGQVIGSSRDARLVVIHTAKKPAGQHSSSTRSSSGTAA